MIVHNLFLEYHLCVPLMQKIVILKAPKHLFSEYETAPLHIAVLVFQMTKKEV